MTLVDPVESTAELDNVMWKKTICTRFFLYSIVLLPLFCWNVSNVFSAPYVFFDLNDDQLPDSTLEPLTAGKIFSIDLYVDEIDLNHGGLISMGLQMTYNPNHFSVIGLTLSSYNWYIPMNDLPRSDNHRGVVEIGGGRINPLAGKILLGSVELKIDSHGHSSLSFGELYPEFELFEGFVAVDGYCYDRDIFVPVPGTWILLSSGLACAIGLRKRFNKS